MELSYRLLLSLHSIIAVSVYPSLINSCFIVSLTKAVNSITLVTIWCISFATCCLYSISWWYLGACTQLGKAGACCEHIKTRFLKEGLSNFQEMGYKIRILITKGNCWILRIGLMGRCQKVTKFDFEIRFFHVINHRNFSHFFF